LVVEAEGGQRNEEIQIADSREHISKSREERAEIKEERAGSREQRAGSRERGLHLLPGFHVWDASHLCLKDVAGLRQIRI
jgi:hypothetical protein